jgi:hypothetical protein
MHDPHLVISNAVIDAIGKATYAKAPEFGCSINRRPGVWKTLQQLDGPVDCMLEGERRLWFLGWR